MPLVLEWQLRTLRREDMAPEKQGKDFISEVKGIMESFESYKIHIACFDTEVYNEEDFSADDGSNLILYGMLKEECRWLEIKR